MNLTDYIRNVLYQKIIIENKISQTNLAKALNITKQSVNKWLNPNYPNALPSIELIPIICELLSITPDYLFGVDSSKLTYDEQQILCEYRKQTNMQQAVKNVLNIK